MSEKRRGLGPGPRRPDPDRPGRPAPTGPSVRSTCSSRTAAARRGAPTAAALATATLPAERTRTSTPSTTSRRRSDRRADGSAGVGRDVGERPCRPSGVAVANDADGAASVDADGLVPVPGALRRAARRRRSARTPGSRARSSTRTPWTSWSARSARSACSSRSSSPGRPAGRVRAHHGRAALARDAGAPGSETIPAIVRETDDGDLLRDALLENLHRRELNPLEEAAAYQQLLDDFGCTHEELAARIARSRPQISNTLRLLQLPPLVQRRVAAGVLSAGHARALLGLRRRRGDRAPGAAHRGRGTLGPCDRGDRRARRATREPAKPARRPRAGAPQRGARRARRRLSDRFETRVKVDLGKTKGRITVEFAR